MNKYRRTLPKIPVVDFLAATLILFATLFLIAFLLIAPTKSKPSILTPGIYAVVISWPPGSNDDVDLYVEDPLKNIVWFGQKDAGLMHLERDDLGTAANNTLTLADGQQVQVKLNYERIIIRGIVPGEYIVDVHMYNKTSITPTVVKATLIRIIDGAIITTNKVILLKNGDEKTEFRFTLNSSGQITNINYLDKSILNDLYGSSNYQNGSQGGNPVFG